MVLGGFFLHKLYEKYFWFSSKLNGQEHSYSSFGTSNLSSPNTNFDALSGMPNVKVGKKRKLWIKPSSVSNGNWRAIIP